MSKSKMKPKLVPRPCWEICRTVSGASLQPWHARLVARNGETICWTENYASRRGAEKAIKLAAIVAVREEVVEG